MPNQLPQYVRLPDELYLGIVADLESGWSLAGLDVKPAPTDPMDPAYAFVERALRQGRLEPASAAEFEHLQDHAEEMHEIANPGPAGEAQGTWNEPALAAASKRARARLVQLRNEDHARRAGITDESAGTPSEYEAWTNQRLKEELKDRGLHTGGEKRELVARLEEDDRQQQ